MCPHIAELERRTSDPGEDGKARILKAEDQRGEGLVNKVLPASARVPWEVLLDAKLLR